MTLPASGPSPLGWHEMDALTRCEWEYLARNIRKIRPADLTTTPRPLAEGLLVHAMRARWFTSGFKTDDATWESMMAVAREEAQRQELPVQIEHERNALRYMHEYVANWKDQPLPTPIATEYEILPTCVSMLHPKTDDLDCPCRTMWKRTARLDDVSRYPEGGSSLWIGECKTTAGKITDCVKFYLRHGQLMLQDRLWHLSEVGEQLHGPIAGIMLDIIRKPSSGGMEFARVPIYITPTIRAWFAERLMSVLNARTYMQSVGFNVVAERNFNSCLRPTASGYISQCPYYSLCENGRSVSGEYQFADGRSLLDRKEGEKWAWE